MTHEVKVTEIEVRAGAGAIRITPVWTEIRSQIEYRGGPYKIRLVQIVSFWMAVRGAGCEMW